MRAVLTGRRFLIRPETERHDSACRHRALCPCPEGIHTRAGARLRGHVSAHARAGGADAASSHSSEVQEALEPTLKIAHEPDRKNLACRRATAPCIERVRFRLIVRGVLHTHGGNRTHRPRCCIQRLGGSGGSRENTAHDRSRGPDHDREDDMTIPSMHHWYHSFLYPGGTTMNPPRFTWRWHGGGVTAPLSGQTMRACKRKKGRAASLGSERASTVASERPEPPAAVLRVACERLATSRMEEGGISIAALGARVQMFYEGST